MKKGRKNIKDAGPSMLYPRSRDKDRRGKNELGLPEDIRVHNSGEANPHDG